jgi:hypothetical protein
MCIITTEDIEAQKQAWLKITKTNIFARHSSDDKQLIAYSLSIASQSAAAMILPLPVKLNSGDNALRFINLRAYSNFFDDLSNACVPEVEPLEDMLSEDFDVPVAAGAPPMLAVQEVGDYEASFVPSMDDFNRLDPRFRLPQEIWQKMPDYSDYGFAVFQLKIALTKDDQEVENNIHPMAFEFVTRNPEKLFFPTVHVHDGDFHHQAGFYHKFYCQRDNARAEYKYQRDLFENQPPFPAQKKSLHGEYYFGGYSWFYQSQDVAGKDFPWQNSEGLVNPDKKLYAMDLIGNYPNHDMWLGDVWQSRNTHQNQEE